MNKIRLQFLALLAVMLTGTGTAYATDYGIYVGETQVTSSNASDVLNNGQFKYNNSTKTLTVTNATLENYGTLGCGIANRGVSGLNIVLVGTNKFTTRMDAFEISYSTTISGTGTLTANCGTSSSNTWALHIYGSGSTLTINGPTLKFTSNLQSVCDYNKNCTIKIEGTSTKVTFSTGGEYEFSDPRYPLSSFTLGSGLYVTRPYNAYFSSSLHSFTTDGRTAIKDDIVISSTKPEAETGYGLYIGETQVTNYNCDDVFGDGMFVYHPASKELDVRSGTFSNSGTLGSGIQNRGVDNLMIWVTGNAVFKTRQDVISSSRSFSIQGPGTLTGTSSQSYGIYLWGDGITCTVAGPTVNLTGASYALRDYYGTSTLEVKAGDRYSLGGSSYATSLTLQPGSNYAAVYNLKKLVRGTNIEISEPRFGTFNSTAKSITEDSYKSDPYKGKVTIGVAWPLYVGGKMVTAKNASKITSDGITAGTVSYDASNKKLTLSGATITSDGDYNCIQNNGVSDLNIYVTGTNNLDITSYGGLQLLCLQQNTSITGSGTLNLKTSGRHYCARVFYGSTLTINGPTVNGVSGTNAFAFYPGSSEKLVVKGTGTKVSLTPGNGEAAVDKLTTFELGSGLYVTQPANASFSSSAKTFTKGGNTVTETLVISSTNPSSIVDYGMYIGETAVNSFNANDILGNGQFSYNNSTKTLTVKNATLTNTNGTLGGGIDNRSIDGLIVNLVGSSTLTTRNGTFYTEKKASIYGTGSLTCVSTQSSGCRIGGKDLTVAVINGPNVKFTGKTYGLEDYYGTSTFRVQGSATNVTLTPGSGNPAVYNLKELNLSSAAITQPSGGTFSSTLKSITADGSTSYKGTVNIGGYTDYGIIVGETVVTSTNASDVLGDGTVSYNASTNTLTVKDANVTNLKGMQGAGILNWSNAGLIVKLEGTSTFYTRNGVIAAQASCSITGSGTINGTSQYGPALSLAGDGITCTVNGPTLNLVSEFGTSVGDYYKNSTLEVRGSSSLTLTPSSGFAAVKDLSKLTLSGQYITSPAFAEFSSSLKSITVGGVEPYQGKVVISNSSPSTPLYIGETAVKASNASDILGNGQFSYNIATKTLTVKNASLDNQGSLGSGIDNRLIEGLVINLVGSNVINARNNPVTSTVSYKITGSGSLTGKSTSSSGLWLGSRCDTCVIDGPTISLTGSNGLRDYNSNSVLRILGSNTSVTLKASSSSSSAIYGLKQLELGDGIVVTEPAGGYFSESLKSITTDGKSAATGTVAIGRVVDYGIIIGERIVTSANCKDVLGDGTFSYDHATKTLTVKNANLDNTVTVDNPDTGVNQGTGISNWSNDGLIINLVGDNVINSRNDVIASQTNMTITGTGTLTGKAVYSNAITLWGQSASTCTIDGPQISITASGSGIYATGNQTLVVKGESTRLTLQPGKDSPAIENLKNLNLEDEQWIVEPQNGYFSTSLAGITTDGENLYKGKLAIHQYKDYGIIIGERIVTSDNCTDVLGDGTISYDPSTKTLTLSNANLDNTVVGPSETGANQGTGISNWSNDGLTVKLEGTNVINSRNAVIASQANMTITGTGTLTGTATESSAMTLWGQRDNTCTINGPKINLTGATNALWAENHQTLVVEGNSHLTLVPGEDSETVYNLRALELGSGISILKPAGAVYNERTSTITVDGEICKSTVVIGKADDYTMYIAETKVTPSNAADILGDGQFSYDPQTKTLTVKNASLENNGALGSGISNRDIDDLNIVFVGDNTFTTRGRAIYSERNFSITGSGSLTARSTSSDALFLATNCDSLIISGPTLNFSAAGNALCDYRRNSKVHVKGTDTKVTLNANSYYIAIDSLAHLELGPGLYITEPEGGFFSPNLYNVTVDGETVYKGTIVISSQQPAVPEDYGISVAFTDITSENAADVLGDGTVSYDPEQKVLTLNNAYITNDNGPVIRNSSVHALTVMVEGQNTLNSMMNVIETEQSVNIYGTGTLNLNSVNLYGGSVEDDPTGAGMGMGMANGNGLMLMGDVSCFITGPTVNITTEGGNAIDSWGSAMMNIGGNTTTLNIYPAPGYAPFSGLLSLGLDSCLQFTEPAGAWYSSDLMGITTDGSSVYMGPVTIAPKQPSTPEPATLAFMIDNDSYTDLTISHNIAEPFRAPMFVANPQDRKIIWRTNITEHPAEGGEPIKVMVGTDPFYVRLLNADDTTTSMGTGQTDVSIVAYDEYVTAMATLNISFYADTYQEPDTTTIDLVAEKANEEVVLSFGGDDSTITEETDLTNATVDGVLFTLNDETGDGYDAGDESIVLNSTMSVQEVAAVMEQMKPGSGAYAAMFSGMTFLLPAGTGSFDVEFLTIGDRVLSVKIGDNAAATLMQNERGTVTLAYDCTEDTYVYIYGSEAEAWPASYASATFTKRAPRRAVAQENSVKLYGITVKPEVVAKEEPAIKGDVNNDKSVDVADIASVISVMAGSAQYGNADVNNDGSVDVADIASIITIMAENARLQKLTADE